MRSNAFISLPLALALVSPGSLGQMLLAATPHKAHRASVRHAASLSPVKKRKSRKPTDNAATNPSPHHNRRHRQLSDNAAPITTQRVIAPRRRTSQQLLQHHGPSAAAPAEGET